MTRFSLLTLPEVSVLSRRMATLSVVAVILVTATSCTATVPSDQLEVAETVDMCAAAAAPGVASDAVEATGEIGTSASATFASPLAVTSTERTVLVEGDGREVTGTDIVDYALTVYDATSGGLISQEGYTGPPQLPLAAATIGPILGCARVGSRVVAVMPETDQGGPTVWVLDVRSASPAIATGAPQAVPDGMPTVTLSEGGVPTITVPNAEPPAEVELAVLKKGDGPLVAAGDTVLLQYSGVRWSNGKVFDASWSKGAPATLTTTDVIEGYRPALEGQTIGSQVLVVIPPASAYGEGAINDTDLTGETLVFVVDLLASAPPR
ncbi:FKBP-type peptidyl-prolyl cis-trans isomerase [Microbacterium lacus]|uniref:peptidylprolyl isomerase n=1 Tax=Microbacterium lacus TaxID=415217 RepID=A0ABN2GDG6_9MICO